MSELDTGDLEELARVVSFHVAGWQEFGYADPPTPESRMIPPLGERGAMAVTAGHDAVKDIDRLTARLHEIRERLVGELRLDEDIRRERDGW